MSADNGCYQEFVRTSDNFKLAVINELMYNQEVLKPYFDIYDYMAYKKSHWDLETDKNIRDAAKLRKICDPL